MGEVAAVKQEVMPLPGELIASLVLKGDLSGLNPTQKVQYYNSMCERIGLDPATQPFKLLNLKGKEVLYCDRSGAQQLNRNYRVSHAITAREKVSDVFIVYSRASLPDGRFTESSGAVPVANIFGENLANAMMKAETKAKRRATLDLLGLGILDESELDTIPHAQKVELPTTTATIQSPGAGDSPTPEKAVTSTASTPSCASPGEFVTPFGREKKGKRIDELTHDEIKKGIAYCQAEGKNQEWVKNALAYLNGLTTGMTLDDSPAFREIRAIVETAEGVDALAFVEGKVRAAGFDKKLSDSEVDRLFALIDGKKK